MQFVENYWKELSLVKAQMNRDRAATVADGDTAWRAGSLALVFHGSRADMLREEIKSTKRLISFWKQRYIQEVLRVRTKKSILPPTYFVMVQVY